MQLFAVAMPIHLLCEWQLVEQHVSGNGCGVVRGSSARCMAGPGESVLQFECELWLVSGKLGLSHTTAHCYTHTHGDTAARLRGVLSHLPEL